MADQYDFFNKTNTMEDTRIEDAKKLLINKGYKITGPFVGKSEVTSVLKLRDYFYTRLFNKYPKKINDTVRNFGKELSITKQMVESRMEGVNKKHAIEECVTIIDTIFDYEDAFKFKFPIIDIGILGQKNCEWITEKAVDIMNRNKIKEEEERRDELIDSISNSIEIDLDARLEELHVTLNKL